MMGFRPGIPRTQCNTCPARNRNVLPVVFRGQRMNMCVPCRKLVQETLEKEAADAAPMYKPPEDSAQ